MASIVNERDKSLQSVAYRTMDTSVTIASNNGALFKTPKNGALTIPTAGITLTATASVIFTAAAVYTWHYALSATPTTWVLIGTGNTQTITTNAFLSTVGNSTAINYRCTVTENLLTTAYGYYNIQYSLETSEPVVTNLSRVVSTVGSNASGTPISFANTDTTITVTRGTTNLTYNSAGGANTFQVAIDTSGYNAVGRTTGTITAVNGGTTYVLADITSLTADSAKVVFIITPYDAAGVAMAPIAREIVYTKVTSGVVGTNAVFYYLDITAPVISKSTSSPLIAGSHSSITVTGKQVNGGTTSTYGYITITGNGGTEVGTAAAGSVTFTPSNTDQKTFYTIKLYDQASVIGATTLDTQIVPIVFIGGSTITTTLTNANTVIPTDASGNAGVYTNTTTDIYVYEGATALTYDAVGTSNGTWKVVTSATDITAGAVTDLGIYGRTSIASNIVANTAFINFNVTGVTQGGQAFTSTATQTFAKSKAGVQGNPGAGTRLVIVNVYAWSNSGIPAYTGSTTYTWATSTNSFVPTNWSLIIPAAPGTGHTLYQLSLTITGLTTDTSTTANWTNAASGTIGYRNDGTIGIQGNSSRTAYIVTTSPTVPGTPTAAIPGAGGAGGDAAPTSTVTNLDNSLAYWSKTATSILTSGQYMYQCDGILNSATNAITWDNPYLSNLKVGSLSAISANLGTINAGQININNKFIVESTGATTIQSGTTGPRMQITENFIKIYDGSILRVQLGNLSM
jgi:hypothetical protein